MAAHCQGFAVVLGMVNFYQHFLPNTAQTLAMLTNLLKSMELLKLIPCEEWHDAAFLAAKATLTTKVLLAHPLPDVPLVLATDAFHTQVGGVLQQKVRGHWQLLGVFSCRLSAKEANYSTFDQDLLAINLVLPQVEGWQFQLWTDHKPLVAAMTRVTLLVSGRQQRHLTFITEHTCGIPPAWTTWWPKPCHGPQPTEHGEMMTYTIANWVEKKMVVGPCLKKTPENF
jgi:RNase H-like domain found in reverse transcriptase